MIFFINCNRFQIEKNLKDTDNPHSNTFKHCFHTIQDKTLHYIQTQMKRLLSSALSALFGIIVINAQTTKPNDWHNEIKPFKHFELALTTGTTGIGLDIATPINKSIQLRTGFSVMPQFEYDMNFDVTVGKKSEDSKSKFEKLAGMMQQMTGITADDEIIMTGEPRFYNFKLLVDIYPLKNKHWHFTTGFYAGPSKIAKAYNTTEDMPSLFAVNMYNDMYEKAVNDQPVIDMGDYCIYMPKLAEYGRMGVDLGYRVLENGTKQTYKMEPDENCMVKIDMKVNRFRPYLGFGYGNSIINSDKEYNISFDCGILFWGGTPQVITHDGTDLAKDVKDIKGKIGRYVDTAKKFKVYPVINLRISKKIF